MYKNFENVLTTPSIEANATTRNVIRRRYSPQEVPWRRIHNAIALAMSICVAKGNKVMDTRDWHSLRGVPPKHDISCFDFKHLLNTVFMFFKYHSPDTSVSTSPSGGEVLKHILRPQCAPDATGFLSDVYNRGTRARKFLADCMQCGRSMIEMLGVLAIIGVLSVGGITGYSKAMEQFKINKALKEYSNLTFGLLEHLDDIKRNSHGGVLNDDITGLSQSLNLIPSSWTRLNNSQFQDNLGNTIQLYVRNDKQLLIFDIFIGGIKTSTDGKLNSPDFSSKLCVTIFQNLVVPMHSAIEYSGVWRSVQGIQSFLGDKHCTSNRGCLVNASLADFQKACNSCGKSNEICDVSYNF